MCTYGVLGVRYVTIILLGAFKIRMVFLSMFQNKTLRQMTMIILTRLYFHDNIPVTIKLTSLAELLKHLLKL